MYKKMGFKPGNVVESLETGERVIVKSVPGQREYDSSGFSSAEYGFIDTDNHWHFQEDFKLVKGKRGRPSTKPRPVKFLLKYDLDEDPIEEFETMDQVNDRIKQLLDRHDLKRDSMVVYEIKSKKPVRVETKISIK